MGLKGFGVVATLMIAAAFSGCSGHATQPSSAMSTATKACSQVKLQNSTVKVGAEGGGTSVPFDGIPSGGASSCAQLLPVSNSSFIEVVAVAAYDGSVGYAATKYPPFSFYANLIVAPNSAAVSRTGTVSFNDTTFSVQQDRGQIAIALSMLDPARTSGPTTECDLRSTTGQPTTCTVVATATTNGGSPIASYSWTIYYAYNNTLKTLSQTGPSPQFSFVDSCRTAPILGRPEGEVRNLYVVLVVTDNAGNTMTLSTTPSDQPLYIGLFTCGS
jgi:hypothetical protein